MRSARGSGPKAFRLIHKGRFFVNVDSTLFSVATFARDVQTSQGVDEMGCHQMGGGGGPSGICWSVSKGDQVIHLEEGRERG